MKYRHKIIILLILLFSGREAMSQIDMGVKLGISVSAGTHVRRIGFNLGGYAGFKSLQSNLIMHAFYVGKSYGADRKGFEMQISENLLFVTGNESDRFYSNFFLHPGSTMSRRSLSIGYGFKQYVDNRQTSQRSAMIHVGYKNWLLSVENDAFLYAYFDKFRTGALSLRYEGLQNGERNSFSQWALAMKIQLFTCDIHSKESVRIHDSLYPSRHGYWDLSRVAMGNRSNGILLFETETNLVANQNMHVQIGLDDERIRHRIQNKWMHDMPIVPKRLDNMKNLHVPMLQENGEAYLFKHGQQIKRTRPFFQFGLNNPLFY